MPSPNSMPPGGLDDGDYPPLPQLGLTLFALWLVVFGSMSQILIVSPILPRIGEQFGADLAALGWLITGYAVPLSLSTLLSGPVSDRLGRRRMLIVGSGALGVSLLAHMLATNFTELMAARVVSGVCGGLLSGGAFAYIGDAIEPRRRGWATGWVNTGFAAGQILSIPLGSWIATQFDARLAFAIFGVVMLAACALVIAVVPQPAVARAGRLTLRSVARSYTGLLSNRATLGACAVYGALFIAIGIFVPYLPLFLEQDAGLSPFAVSLVFTAGGTAMVFAGPRAGALSDRIGRKKIAMAGTFGVGVCMAIMPVAAHAAWAAFLIFAVTMASASSRSGALRTLVTELTGPAARGTLIYVTLALGQLGFALGSALAGTTNVAFGFVGNAMAGALISVLMAGLIGLWLPETLPPQDASAEPVNA